MSQSQFLRANTRLFIRSDKRDDAPIVKDDRGVNQMLHIGEIITVEDEYIGPAYIWVKHRQGWSAKGVVGGASFMEAVDPAQVTATTTLASGLERFVEPKLYVVNTTVSVRLDHNVNAPRVKEDGVDVYLQANEIITARARFVGNSHTWLQHEKGWSAQQVKGGEIYITPLGTVPLVEPDDKRTEVFEEPRPYVALTNMTVRVSHGVGAAEVYDDTGKPVLLEIGDTVLATARYRGETYYWIQYEMGWTAERIIGGAAFMQRYGGLPSSAGADSYDIERFDKPRKYVVLSKVSVRVQPHTSGARVRENGQLLSLKANEIITVDARSEGDYYSWVHHAKGWSAEKKLTVNESTPFIVPEAATRLAPEENQIDGVALDQIAYLRVVGGVSIRESAATGAAVVGFLVDGEIIKPTSAQLKTDQKYVWVQHARGWSAVRSRKVDGTHYLRVVDVNPAKVKEVVHKGRMLLVEELFQRMPVDAEAINWIQYFGSTNFARKLAAGGIIGAPATSYAYGQGFHPGLDFGNHAAKDTRIYAAMHGTVSVVERQSRYYRPNFVKIVHEDYIVIYGHMSSVSKGLKEGDIVTPDSVIGGIKHGWNAHLHFEVRYMDAYILNPMLFMPTTLQKAVMNLDRGYDLFITNDYDTPLNQPVIKRSGEWAAPWPKP